LIIEYDKRISAAAFKETVIKNQRKDKFWLDISIKVSEMHREGSDREVIKMQVEKSI
jgi:hypothetical protein